MFLPVQAMQAVAAVAAVEVVEAVKEPEAAAESGTKPSRSTNRGYKSPRTAAQPSAPLGQSALPP